MWALVILTLASSSPLFLCAQPDPGSTETLDTSHRTIVYPIRVDSQAHPYPQHLQYRRKFQAVWYGRTLYRFENFNKTWIIELQPSHQHHRFKESNLTKLEAQTPIQSECYYKGRILSETLSTVEVNLCNGMTGDIHTADGSYVIYPLPADGKTSILPHHLSPMELPDPERPWRPMIAENINFCDVKDDTANLEKLKYEMENSHQSNVHNSSMHLIRKKRSESRELHLEVLVVADSKMAAYHGNNLRHYILTLMSTVALIYKDPSIGNNINIAVVDIVVLNQTADHEVIHHIAPITLRKFCRWQQKNNRLDDRDPAHYDTAILITREDLCRFPGACDTLGLAQSGMVCDTYSSCAIVEDNGLSAAFTIAHELGHVMSIPHDDDSKCTRHHPEKRKLHVMARMLDYNSHPWSWSECSRQYLTTFFDIGYGHCLMDRPGRNLLVQDDEFQQPPGQLYPRDRQCELVFGPKSRICPYMPECKRLWCTMDDTPQGGCRTQHMPWADGTRCSEGKRCFQGECVRYLPDGLTPVDGQWGKWKPFGKCSRSCGGGIQQAFRECDSPKPANGGRYCTGIRVKYKSCNFQECPEGSRDFRAEQCSEFDNQDLNLPGLPSPVKWVPQYSGMSANDKCKLYCKVSGSASYFVLKEKVIDGTLCELGSFSICVNGNCESAGCDHVLHSPKVLDRCGVCGGNNSTCKEIVGHFNQKLDYGYHNVVMIPPGASNIQINQHSSDDNVDDNYIALKDSEEKYILNGDFMISMFPKRLLYHGITIDYSGSDAVIEYVNSSKPLPKDLFVQVLVVGKLNPPNISFSYTVPITQSKLYIWKLATQYSECTRMCDGISFLKPICVRLSDQHPVNDNHCANLDKPNLQKIRKCNDHCELRWKDVNKSECSVQCGRGISHRIVKCMKEDKTTDISHAVPEEHCKHLGPKPSSQVKCRGSCLNSTWVYSEWSECSISCGKGNQHRSAECRNSNKIKQPDSHCDPSSKVVSRECDQGPCPIWQVGDWTECSVTCGTGIKQRPFWCEYDGKYVDHRYCTDEEPLSKETCSFADCYDWIAEEWELCPIGCGDAVVHRNVYCYSSSQEKVSETYCAHLPRPTSYKNCSSNPQCGNLVGAPSQQPGQWSPAPRILSDTNSISEFSHGVWRKGEWSKCSSPCGEGISRRTITCHNSEDESRLPLNYCDVKIKPKTTEKCIGRECGKWEIGNWSKCSCLRLIKERHVLCVKDNMNPAPESSCNPDNKPAISERCDCAPQIYYNFPGLSSWKTGPWSECSVSCGVGIKRRQVVCYNIDGLISSDCNVVIKPLEVIDCDGEICPVWKVGDWSECSVSCGKGTQVRPVECVHHTEKFEDENCDLTAKPEKEQECMKEWCMQEENKWLTGPWSECSATCGEGIQQRNIYCINAQGHRTNPDQCPVSFPDHTRICASSSCPVWKWSEWSQCPKSCGFDEQQRYPHCIKGERIVKDEECFEQKPSPEARQCKISAECSFKWQKGTWSQCHASCGLTYKVREVVCIDNDHNRVSDEMCALLTKPKNKKKCDLKPCPYMWKVGPWSECSKSCNTGVQSRTVACHSVNLYGYPNPEPLNEFDEHFYCDLSKRPKHLERCNYGNCSSGHVWHTGEWEACEGPCHKARQKRKLHCFTLDGKRVGNYKCDRRLKPQKKQRCFTSPECPLKSCLDFYKRGRRDDGDYQLHVRGRLVTIYCHNMNGQNPQEYITLSGYNYAKIYSHEMADYLGIPENCHRNNVVLTCECNQAHYGYTVFYKVALNITSLHLIGNDFTFTDTYYGRPIPFATAGDCSRIPKCLLGSFAISLEGTDFRVASTAKWVSKDGLAHVYLHRAKNDQVIGGKCGGFCDTCGPSSQLGVPMDVMLPS